MIVRHLLCFAVAALLPAAPADAVTIHLIDSGGRVTGSKAEEAFRIAADFWEHIITNGSVINIRIDFTRIGDGRGDAGLGIAMTRQEAFSIRAWENAVERTKSHSAIDTRIVLPRLKDGAIAAMTLGMDAAGRNDVAKPMLLRRDQRASRYLLMSSSVAKATGLPLDRPDKIDAEITLNSGYAFDFDPSDGMTPSGVDLVAVAIHEMGHALGFGSGVSGLDMVAAPNGPAGGPPNRDFNTRTGFEALDMFRYGAPGLLDLRPGADAYFSIDGGRTALLGVRFATGAFNGDGQQAGHFRQTADGCSMKFGIMDAGRCGGQMGVVTGADLAAFDAIGWNLSVDALSFAKLSTGELVRQYRARHAPSAS